VFIAVSIVILGLALAWANGANDVAKGVATLVGSGAALAKRAVAWGALWTTLGGLSHATEGRDGLMRANIRVPKDQYIWEPAFIVMPHAGELELEFDNQDQNVHMALLPSNGARQLLHLPIYERGRARISLDQPGLYWFGCPVANHAGRGMLGFIWVYGQTPEEARLDRPKQPQPQDD
jgi:Phosphate/sulphate permeases